MEVLGALAMDDASFLKDMCVDEKVETKKQKKTKSKFNSHFLDLGRHSRVSPPVCGRGDSSDRTQRSL
jgi:hypothetical protein